MDVLEAIATRRSVRDFTDEEVARADIERVVEAGLMAASGRGAQSTAFVVVTNKELRDEIAEANRKIGGWKEGFDPFYGAPVIICVLGRTDIGTYVYDGSLALGNMMLAAHALGLGSIWIHRAREEFATERYQGLVAELGLEGDYEGIGHLALGHAGTVGKAAPRRQGRVAWAE